MNRINKIIDKLKKCDYLIFIVVSILFALIFSQAAIGGDDVSNMRVPDGTILDYWNKSAEMYKVWSSRIFVNFVLYIFTDSSLIWWAIFMGISMFVLLQAISILFVRENKKMCNNFIACMVMLFPFWHLVSAGWIATCTTYFSPMAFGMMSLVPIKKCMYKEKFSTIEYIFYPICLLYGANNEQLMIVILLSYLVALAIFIKDKKIIPIIVAQTFLSFVSLAIVLFSPGNSTRKELEIVTWFPAFKMLNLIDKVEIGYDTGIWWLVFGGELFIIVSSVVISVLIWLRYKDLFIRFIAIIPPIALVVFGYLNGLLARIYPYAANVKAEIPYWGLVNVENRGGLGAFCEFAVMNLILVIIVIELFLLCDEWKELISVAVILIAGVGSRVAIGLSPTVYASDIRTCSIMCFTIISVVCYVFAISVKSNKIAEIVNKFFMPLMNLSLIINFINLCYVVFFSFR